MKLSNNFQMTVKAQRQHGTSCIVLRRSLSPMRRRSNRKVTSHLNSSKPYSSKHLHSTLVLTSMKCAGSRQVGQVYFSQRTTSVMLCGTNVRSSQAEAPSLFACSDKTAWWPETAGTPDPGSTQAHVF